MPLIHLETDILAPIERVFDLARSIDLHKISMESSQERAVNGVTSGLIELGQTVTWEAVHFGVRQRLTSKITICERPRHLQDVMVGGAFAGFTHDHFLSEIEGGTLMRDDFDYRSPLGPLGSLADVLFLETYMTKLLAERNATIKRVAESDEWRKIPGI
jgi:ligand-binding SRPBCC domain-containing protein